MKKQYAVIGLGRFGSSLAKELIELGFDVLGIDSSEQTVEKLNGILTRAVIADSTDIEALKALGIGNFDCVIVAIGNDIQSSILTSMLLKELEVKTVVAKALTELHGKVLNKMGVDRIVYPERDMGIRVAHQLASPNLLDYIEISKDYTVAELSVPKRLSGLSLKELDLRVKYGCSVIAINRKDSVTIAPMGTDILNDSDVMVIIGNNQQIIDFEREFID
ncbi:TrkA family potassium uptake protein [Paenibacillus psychroresistens]|uniref:TrkA family potassium uptake protein n=1 Tax=Paenibacillus psychroresistens TaxID=1778678 RepID=A0A6B8RTU0_9BACL|nr:TrkA family potassium uptake protein [Paenibacillus psychroresistens]QGQ98726.1 TrkA family potassium uptake protein [Paenibacillus psychroresistens]